MSDKYELLKKVDSGFGPDTVEAEYMTTNIWKEVLSFVREYQFTTVGLSLHVRFNEIPSKHHWHTDLDSGQLYNAADEYNKNYIMKLSLKNVKDYIKSLESYQEEDICYEHEL